MTTNDMTWYRLQRALADQRANMLRFVAKVCRTGGGLARVSARRGRAVRPGEPVCGRVHALASITSGRRVRPIPGARDKALLEVIPTAEYLLRRKKSLPPLLREYLQESLLLGDLFTREEHRMIERSALSAMDKGNLVFGQVARVGGVALLEACQAFVIPPIWKVQVVKFRDSKFANESRVLDGRAVRARYRAACTLPRDAPGLFERKPPDAKHRRRAAFAAPRGLRARLGAGGIRRFAVPRAR